MLDVRKKPPLVYNWNCHNINLNNSISAAWNIAQKAVVSTEHIAPENLNSWTFCHTVEVTDLIKGMNVILIHVAPYEKLCFFVCFCVFEMSLLYPMDKVSITTISGN